MTLTRLVLAWVAVAIWFVIATIGCAALVGWMSRPTGREGRRVEIPFPLIKWRLVEAVLVTLFASLWFDSLGSGEWWLVFLLVGAIAAAPPWMPLESSDGRPGRACLVGASADLARYVLAGAILAWRLG